MKYNNMEVGNCLRGYVKIFISVIVLSLFVSANVCSQSMLNASGIDIVNEAGEQVYLKGVNVGNWALQEGWMISNDGNHPGTQSEMKQILKSRGFSTQEIEDFYQGWRDNFVTEPDIEFIASKGMNCIRLPLHYELFLTDSQRAVRDNVVYGITSYTEYKNQLASWVDANAIATDFTAEAYVMIDNLLNWCATYGIYVILDMHAVPGSQGTDEHIADCLNTPNDLWYSAVNQDVLNAMWDNISDRYKNNPTVAMYDLINEPNNIPNPGIMQTVYQRLITTIRNNGDDHLIMIEGNGWGNDYTGNTPDLFSPQGNLVFSIHRYDFDAWACPNDLDALDLFGNENQINYFGRTQAFRAQYNVPIFCGETGLRYYYWMSENTKALKTLNIGWTIWSYKWHTPLSSQYGFGNIPGIKPAEIYSAADMVTVLENIKYNNMVPNTIPDFWNALIIEDVAVTGVELLPNNLTVYAGTSQQLNANVLPANATNKSVNWSSSNTAVATVVNGLVTGNEVGTAEITVTTVEGGFSATSTVNVEILEQDPYGGVPWGIPGTIQAEDFDIGGQNLAYFDSDESNNGGQYRLDESVDIEVCSQGGYNVGWIEANEWLEYTVNIEADGIYDISMAVASPIGSSVHIELDNSDITGLMTVPSTGDWQQWVDIEASNVSLPQGEHILKIYMDGEAFNIDKINIEPAIAIIPVTGISVSPTNIIIEEGDNQQLVAEISPVNATNKNVTWSTSNPDVATISNGLVVGVSAGNAIISVTSVDGNFTATTNVEVKEPYIPCESVSISNNNLTLVLGETYQLNANVLPINATIKNVSWNTNNASVAEVSSNGMVTAISQGVATVSVITEDGAFEAICEVEVLGDNFSVRIEAENYYMMQGMQTEDCIEGGQNLGWIDGGDWAIWHVDLPISGTYTIEYRVASLNGGGEIQLERGGGSEVYGNISVPKTNGWQEWTTILHSVNLSAGYQELAIYVPSGGYNINWLQITQGGVKESKLKFDNEMNERIVLNVYPNPAKSFLNVKVENLEEMGNVVVHNLLGQTVLNTALNSGQTTIDISELKKGTYIITVLTTKMLETKAFIKE